jgi:hypothetical protein
MKEKLIAAAKRWKPGRSWADYDVLTEDDQDAFMEAYYLSDQKDSTGITAMWFLLLVAEAVEE